MAANDSARAVEKCEENARKLIDSARLLVKHDGSTSAAYHLAILAIEEIGKACLLKIGQVNGLLGKEFALERRLDDHSQKLFLGIFSAWLFDEWIHPCRHRTSACARAQHA